MDCRNTLIQQENANLVIYLAKVAMEPAQIIAKNVEFLIATKIIQIQHTSLAFRYKSMHPPQKKFALLM